MQGIDLPKPDLWVEGVGLDSIPLKCADDLNGTCPKLIGFLIRATS
jgi:hypothetical protein